MIFGSNNAESYIMELVDTQLLPLFNLLIGPISYLIALSMIVLAGLSFSRQFAYAGSSGMDIRQRQNNHRSIYAYLFLGGFFGALGRFIVLSSNTFFERDNSAFYVGTSGITSNVSNWYEALYLMALGFGVINYIRAGLLMASYFKGREEAASEARIHLFAGLFLANMQSIIKMGRTTLKLLS